MDAKNIITLGALAVAGLALVLGRSSAPVVQGSGGTLGGITLGDGPVFNFQGQGNGQYMGNGGYPPFNSCGCGKADGAVRVAAKISPVFGDAIQKIPGVPMLPVTRADQDTFLPPRNVSLVSNGAFV